MVLFVSPRMAVFASPRIVLYLCQHGCLCITKHHPVFISHLFAMLFHKIQLSPKTSLLMKVTHKNKLINDRLDKEIRKEQKKAPRKGRKPKQALPLTDLGRHFADREP